MFLHAGDNRGDDWRPLDNLEDKEDGQITIFDEVVAGGS
jgi:hypothetical protein